MTRRLWNFPGGLRLPGFKQLSNRAAIERLPLPRRVVLPLRQHAGQPAVPLVQVGERVLTGQLVARAASRISANIHASTSGTVVNLGTHPLPHRSGIAEPCIVIEPDGLDMWMTDSRPTIDPWRAPVAELVERIEGAGIVGLGGAVFPASVKMKPTRPIDTLVVNGVECEPYITCDDVLMRSRPRQILRAALLLQRVVGAQECMVAIEDNKPEALAALREVLPEVRRERPEAAIDVVEVPTRFPAGGERQLIKVLTGREVPSGGLPFQVGVVCVNVGTVAAVYDAIFDGRPLVARIVTVTGEAVRSPRNFEVRLGTPISELLEAAGGCTTDQYSITIGGPMMGAVIDHHNAPIVKGSNCILVRESALETRGSMPCIRCGTCADVCPMRLLPQQLYWHARARHLEKAQAYNLFDCIECGCCSQVCPAHIPLVNYYRFAKDAIRQQRESSEKAAIARRRNENRSERIERLKRETLARKARSGVKPSLGETP